MFLFRERNQGDFLKVLIGNFDSFLQRTEYVLASVCCARHCGFGGEPNKCDPGLRGAGHGLGGG